MRPWSLACLGSTRLGSLTHVTRGTLALLAVVHGVAGASRADGAGAAACARGAAGNARVRACLADERLAADSAVAVVGRATRLSRSSADHARAGDAGGRRRRAADVAVAAGLPEPPAHAVLTAAEVAYALPGRAIVAV